MGKGMKGQKSPKKKALRVKDLAPKSDKPVTGGRQTPKMDFGDRMKAGLDTAAGVVASTTTTTST